MPASPHGPSAPALRQSTQADRILAEHARDVANTVGLDMSTAEALALRRRFEARLERLESIEAPNAELFRRAHEAASLRRLAEPHPNGLRSTADASLRRLAEPPSDALHSALDVGVAGDHR